MSTFSRGFGAISAATVDAAENRLGVKLPDDYKDFLRVINGGCPKPDVFLVPDRGPATVGILYGIRSERTDADLEYEQAEASMWHPLPSGHIAIGHDPGGNTLLLSMTTEECRVYFWDRGGLWVRDDGQNTFPVAASFTAFLESLQAQA